MQREIEPLLAKGAIIPITQPPAEQDFISTVLLVPKKDGGARPVINLRALNCFISSQDFKMEGVHLLKELIKSGNWVTRVDLKHVYFTVPIHPTHQRYLRFIWKQEIFQFTCFQLSLSSAPRVFIKLMKPVNGYLWSKGVKSVVYIDDILLIAQSPKLLKQHTLATLNLLEAPGYLVNYPKSQLIPTQSTTFLGFVVDCQMGELSLPSSKVKSIQKEAQHLITQPLIIRHQLAQFIGKLSAAILPVHPAPLHYRSIQQLKHKALVLGGYDQQAALSRKAKEDITWWIQRMSDWNGRKILDPPLQIVIETDASLRGWGVYSCGTFTGGCWSPEEALLHINVLKMLAVLYGVKSFVKGEAKVKTVLIKQDNITVVPYLNHMGGTKSQTLIDTARQVWEWCLQKNITLSSTVSTGVGECQRLADFLS